MTVRFQRQHSTIVFRKFMPSFKRNIAFPLAAFLFLAISACSRPVPFSAYLAEQLLQENLNSLTEQPVFELRKIEIQSVEAEENTGSASTDIVLLFPQSLADIAKQQGLEEGSAVLQQYRSSFGDFEAGEIQRHHARYLFQKRGKKWLITGSQPLAPPDIHKP
ncbi:hypothetical protein IB286_06590 [Spongiibacter sp. KMU-158]|uniref:Uncharacterized protein n=1 Tax=Spongiibacter pelagi TaxID=2760804 RepID=A0A927BZX0_9GAMM|nr:hypothetical protein [Spongiibacter pelagi]MBD2858675.1 hypothetical protein [Spongiibacter pelagi]